MVRRAAKYGAILDGVKASRIVLSALSTALLPLAAQAPQSSEYPSPLVREQQTVVVHGVAALAIEVGRETRMRKQAKNRLPALARASHMAKAAFSI
jgi:hypothetical protein